VILLFFEGMASLSFVVRGIRASVNGLVHSLIIVTDQSLREICLGIPRERNRIHELISESGFLSFTLTLTYDHLRQHIGYRTENRSGVNTAG
jgi:hypothetical protein